VRHDETIGNDVDDEVLDPEEALHLVGGGSGGRRRKGREENGEGEEVNVTYPVVEAWRDRWQ
jgi:hypothetical protein